MNFSYFITFGPQRKSVSNFFLFESYQNSTRVLQERTSGIFFISSNFLMALENLLLFVYVYVCLYLIDKSGLASKRVWLTQSYGFLLELD